MINKNDLRRTSGVYMIINTVNKRFYIGSTRDFQARWQNHLSCFVNQAHSNSAFQRCWNESRQEDFEFIVLEEVEDIEHLVEREVAWMKTYRVPDNDRCFNPRLAVKQPMHWRKRLEMERLTAKRSAS